MNQDFHGDVGLVVNGDVKNIRLEQPVKRPKTPEQSRICPQCHESTWRRSQLCVHCNLDLFAHDMEKKREAELLAAQARRGACIKIGKLMTFVGAALFVIGTNMEDVAFYTVAMTAAGLLVGVAGLAILGRRASN